VTVILQEKKAAILSLLASIESERKIKIIHAVESGSRAWGFPSVDSDYDVRFIYCHERDWYITPFDRKDTIDISMQGDLDAGGWDISKCLSLLYKGNAVLQEWLNSPVIYRSNPEVHLLLRDFAAREFSPAAGFYHYISLAKRKFLDEATVSNAKYFLYGLRAVLCAQFISQHKQVPPVLFDTLVKSYVPASEIPALNHLLKYKSQGGEKDKLAIPSGLWSFAMETYEGLNKVSFDSFSHADPEIYNQLLRSVLSKSFIT
jgi:predicted nucleotidyltransferase